MNKILQHPEILVTNTNLELWKIFNTRPLRHTGTKAFHNLSQNSLSLLILSDLVTLWQENFQTLN